VPADPASAADSGSRWHLDNIGRPVTSRLDADVLRRVAEQTGGRYAAWDDATARAAIIAAIRRISARPLGTQRVAQHVELFQWPLAAAVLLLALEGLLAVASSRPHAFTPSRPRWGRRLAQSGSRRATLASCLVPLALLLACSPQQRAYTSARRAYARAEYPSAFELYRDRLAGAKDPLVQLGAGNAAYRVSRFEDAAAAYRRVVDAPRVAGNRAHFNLGNAWFRAAQATKEREGEFYDLAIQAYEQALRRDPADADARWNLELALRKRGETETGGSPGRGGRAIAGEGDGSEEGLDSDREQAIGAMAGGGSGDAQGESAEELSEDEARRLLESIEKEQLTAHEGRPGRRGQRAERDW
jgi:tetratricopeptide (TPR) repeat protein